MINKEEISQILREDPENFGALFELAISFKDEGNFAGAFAMAERAIESYENNPIPSYQNSYFIIKRLHLMVLKEHLDTILGPAFQLLDQRWMPVFKLGRPREMAWNVTTENLKFIEDALNAPQLKKLRFLNINVLESPDEVWTAITNSNLANLKALNIQFIKMPDSRHFKNQLRNAKTSLTGITTATFRMPRLDDTLAIPIRESLGTLEAFNLTSLERSGISPGFCEALADDERSNTLTRLSLVGTTIGNEGLFAILSSENFSSLQALDLRDGIMTNGAARVITAAHNLPKLRSIDVSYNMIDPAGINMLQSATKLEIICEGQHERPRGRKGTYRGS